MEEQISKSAGADAGEYLPVEEIRRLIEEMGRIPVERTTTYGKISASGTLEANGGPGWRCGSVPLPSGPDLAH